MDSRGEGVSREVLVVESDLDHRTEGLHGRSNSEENEASDRTTGPISRLNSVTWSKRLVYLMLARYLTSLLFLSFPRRHICWP